MADKNSLRSFLTATMVLILQNHNYGIFNCIHKRDTYMRDISGNLVYAEKNVMYRNYYTVAYFIFFLLQPHYFNSFNII